MRMYCFYSIVNISSLSQNDYERGYSIMNEDRKRRVDRFRSVDDRKRSVCGELLARRMIAGQCQIASEKVIIDVTDRGKPFARDLPVEFSISHSGEYVLCAVSDSPVGADIERIRPVRVRLVRRVCTADEWKFVSEPGISEQEKTERFFRVWTAKEAYFKCLGTGITDLNKVCTVDEGFTDKLTYFIEKSYAVSIVGISEPVRMQDFCV